MENPLANRNADAVAFRFTFGFSVEDITNITKIRDTLIHEAMTFLVGFVRAGEKNQC